MADGSHWLFGHVTMLTSKDAWKKLAVDNANTDGICSFWFGSKRRVTLTNAEHIKYVFNTSSIRRFMHHMRQAVGPGSLFSIHGKEWKLYRSVVHRALASSSALRDMKVSMQSVSETLVKSLMEKISAAPGGVAQYDMGHLSRMITVDITGKSLFGVDFQCCEKFENPAIVEAFDFIVADTFRRPSSKNIADHIYSIPTPNNHRFKNARSSARSFLKNVIQQRHMDGSEGTNFISKILEISESSEDDGMGMEILIDQLLTLYIGSYDTLPVAFMFTFYHLAKYPEVSRKCIEEVERLIAEGGSFQDTDRLVYCGAAIQGTLLEL